MSTEVVVVTHFPSPYQVELFDAIEARGKCSLRVYYLRSSLDSRSWSLPKLAHQAYFLSDESVFQRAQNDVYAADVAILNFYNDRLAQRLIRIRAQTGRPWIFWGERPHTRRLQQFSKLFRRWKLYHLHHSQAPIWGIGRMAVDAYRKEFGALRRYYNVPYFSNLERFSQCVNCSPTSLEGDRVFLFSGALIKRKAIDLVAIAFRRLVQTFPNVKLKIVGAGPLHKALLKVLSSCANKVEILGFRDWNHLPSIYAQAHVLCVPSRYDGWGMVVPEGLASGLPVISTAQTGAATELLVSGRNGWLIQGGDLESLYRAMSHAATLSLEHLNKMSRFALADIQHHSLCNGTTLFLDAAQSAISDWDVNCV